MGTYELDDDAVKRLSEWRTETTAVMPLRIRETLNALCDQIPIPLPTGLGAVVRATEGLAIRADLDQAPWCLHRPDVPYVWADDGDLGRVLEVLSNGIDITDLTGGDQPADPGHPPQDS